MDEQIQDTWIDNRSGSSIFVDDIIMDGDKMIVKTSAGIIDGEVFSNHFIKVSDKEISESEAKVLPKQDIVKTMNENIDPEYKVELNKDHDTLKQNNNDILDHPLTTSYNKIKNTEHNINYNLIDKVVKKTNYHANIDMRLSDDNVPIDEFKMLVNVFDVSIGDIADYIIDKYFDKLQIKKYIYDSFEKLLK